jgi:HPt (histidine-containing phosphotransfer) domain-containing protein
MALDTSNNSSLIRTNVWANEVKDVLQEELMLDSHVRWITEFPDGDTLNIPTLSEMTVRNYTEGAQVTLDDPTTGNYTLTISKYYQSGFKIPEKFRHDSFYVSVAESNFVQKLTRALLEQKESDIATLQTNQTASNPNTINSVDHRFVATGTSNVMTLADIQKAKLALDKAKVMRGNRRCFVDPSVTYQLQQISNVIQQDVYGGNAHVKEGMNGTAFVGRFAGFDLFESLFLDSGIAQTITATAPTSGALTSSSAFANMFIGEEAFIGAMRAMPDMDAWYDNNTRSDVYHVTMRYGIDLFRPESLVVVLSD